MKHSPEAPSCDNISTVIKKRKISWMTGKKLESELVSDKIEVNVLEEVIEEVDASEHKETRCQDSLDRFLQYTPLQVFLLILAVADVALVVSEILVTLHVYEIETTDYNNALESMVKFLSRLLDLNKLSYLEDLKETLNKTFNQLKFNQSSPTSSSQSRKIRDVWENLQQIRQQPLARAKRAVAIDIASNGLPYNPRVQTLHIVEEVLDIITIVILGIFVLMVIFKIIASGRKFFLHITEILDSAVSIISFILYIIKHAGVLRKDATEAVIVLLLLWQIVRMFNGIMLSEIKRLDFRIKLLKRTRKKLESKTSEKNNRIKTLEKEVENLKTLSKSKGANENEITSCRPVKKNMKPSFLIGMASIASMTIGVSLGMSVVIELEKQKQSVTKLQRKRKSGNSLLLEWQSCCEKRDVSEDDNEQSEGSDTPERPESNGELKRVSNITDCQSDHDKMVGKIDGAFDDDEDAAIMGGRDKNAVVADDDEEEDGGVDDSSGCRDGGDARNELDSGKIKGGYKWGGGDYDDGGGGDERDSSRHDSKGDDDDNSNIPPTKNHTSYPNRELRVKFEPDKYPTPHKFTRV